MTGWGVGEGGWWVKLGEGMGGGCLGEKDAVPTHRPGHCRRSDPATVSLIERGMATSAYAELVYVWGTTTWIAMKNEIVTAHQGFEPVRIRTRERYEQGVGCWHH